MLTSVRPLSKRHNIVERIDSTTTTANSAPPLTWDDAIATGKRNIAKLENPPEESVNSTPWRQNYKEDTGKFPTKQQKVTDTGYYPAVLLDLLKVTKTTLCTRMSILSKEGERPGQGGVSQNCFIPDNGIILALSNFKENDYNPKDKKLRSGELMIQAWGELAGDKKTDLQWIVRSHIVNDDTKAIIRQASTKLGKKEKMLIRVSPDDKDPSIFEALSGTPNARGTYPTLANHFQELNGPKVTDVYIYYEAIEGHNYYFAMELKDQCG